MTDFEAWDFIKSESFETTRNDGLWNELWMRYIWKLATKRQFLLKNYWIKFVYLSDLQIWEAGNSPTIASW